MTSSKTYFSDLVGNRFRQSGSLILPVLEVDHPLILDPEPDNNYDPLAVRVSVDAATTKYSLNGGEDGYGPIIHLGYLPRSGTKTCTTGFGNKEALSIMQGSNWSAFLAFAPTGEPLVRIEVHDMEGLT